MKITTRQACWVDSQLIAYVSSSQGTDGLLDAGHLRDAAIQGIMHVLRGYWAAAISEAGISVEHRMQYEHLRMVRFCMHLIAAS